eukprot:EG_transcript_10863
MAASAAPRGLYLAELKELFGLAWPVLCSYVLQTGLAVVNVLALGWLGVKELDGASLGSLCGNVTGVSVVTGLIMAMDTLAPQAYGARNYPQVGCIAQRAALVSLTLSLPVALLWWNFEAVFAFLQLDADVAQYAVLYLRVFSLGLVPLALAEVVKKYIIAQGVGLPITYLMGVTLAFDVAATYVLVWRLGLGFAGSPLALALSYGVFFALGLLYVRYAARWRCGEDTPDLYRCWGGWSPSAFQGWGTFLSLGVPAAMQLCLEWWAYEAITLQAGLLGTTALAAVTISMQLSLVLWMVPFSMAIAVAVRVGQHLGADDGAAARRSCCVALALMGVVAAFNAALMVLIRRGWARAFTADPAVVDLTGNILLLFALCLVCDAFQVCAGGVLRGTGQQNIGAAINFLAMWAVGVPLGSFATFGLGCGVTGLFYGLFLAVFLQAVLQGVVVARIDWSAKAKEAHARAREGPTPTDDETTPLLPTAP